MKITLLVVGKTDEKYLKEGIDIYVNRLSHYISFSIQEIPALKNSGTLSVIELKQKEGAEILKRIEDGTMMFLLDEYGKQYTSVKFAEFMQQKMNQGIRHVCFVIGGAFGFSEEVKQKSQGKISLSDMTFSHQMIRLFFTEQVYRAMTILRNEKYHNE